MPQRTLQDAKFIAEHLLDVTGRAMLSGDFASFAEVFHLPQVMAIRNTNVSVETEDDLRAVFDAMGAYFKEAGITEIRRTCEHAEYLAEDTVRATHLSRLMIDDTLLREPYPVTSTLLLVDGIWKVGAADYSLEPHSPQAQAILRPRKSTPGGTGIFKKMTARHDKQPDPKAMAIYQANLDAVSAAVLGGAPEAALEHLRAPYYMRTSQELFAFNNREDIIDSIKTAQLSLRVQGATDYVRTATLAYFISDTEISGLHVTRILRGTEQLMPPYENRMRLQLSTDGKWQVIHAEHTSLLKGWPNFGASHRLAKLRDVDQLSQADEVARAVYQEYLDALTDANMTQDFDAWVALCAFPHKVIIDRLNRDIETPDDIKPFFDMVSGHVRDNPGAMLKRHGEMATFVNSHTIRGYHRTTFDGEGVQVFPPVRGRFTIELNNNAWQMTEVVNAIANPEFPYEKPIASEALGSEWTQGRT